MAFDKTYYEVKLAKIKARSDRTVQEYVNAGIKFGQDVADLNTETTEIKQLIADAEAQEQPKKDDKTTPIRK